MEFSLHLDSSSSAYSLSIPEDKRKSLEARLVPATDSSHFQTFVGFDADWAKPPLREKQANESLPNEQPAQSDTQPITIALQDDQKFTQPDGKTDDDDEDEDDVAPPRFPLTKQPAKPASSDDKSRKTPPRKKRRVFSEDEDHLILEVCAPLSRL
jgi:hypothetical protein